MSRRNSRSAWIGGFIVLFGLFQIVLPAIMLREPRPARFGWQMFTQGRMKGTFAIVHPDGTRTPVRRADYVVADLPEVRFYAVLPAHLCRVIPAAHAIAVTDATGLDTAERVTRCR